MPCGEVAERLGREDEGEIGKASLRPGLGREELEGVDGEGGAIAIDLDPRKLEAIVARDRQGDHREAMLRLGHRLLRLVGRDPCRDEEDALQPERFAHRLGDRQMAVVDRVERPAEDPERAGHHRDGAAVRPA